MIFLITGTPGAGKTLRAVWHVQQYVAAGRRVFADIDGLAIPGVEPAPDDWRDTPDGSVVVYDEAQRRFGSEGARAGRTDRPDVVAMETHRHTGHDLILITQHPSLVSSHVRRLGGRHEHVQRVFGSGRTVVSWRDRAWDVESRSERQSAVTEHWAHPKELFALYSSASIHTGKARVPGRVKFLAGFAALLLVVASYSAWRFFSAPSLSEQIEHAGGIERGTVTASPSSSAGADVVKPEPWKVKQVVGGCISTVSRCQCYSRSGHVLDMDIGECFRLVSAPLPMQLPDLALTATTSPQRERSEPAAQSLPAPAGGDSAAAQSAVDPVALSGHVDPVALSAGGAGRYVVSAVPQEAPVRIGNFRGGTRPVR
jgi:hypothetical protein